MDEADERLDGLVAATKLKTKAETGGLSLPGKAGGQAVLDVISEEGPTEYVLKAFAHDWDSEGDFALFEYNLVSTACSHPEFGSLCDIIEGHEDEDKAEHDHEKAHEKGHEMGIAGLAQSWDSDGEFALFEYNLVSRECSHPELVELCFIDEEDEEEDEEAAVEIEVVDQGQNEDEDEEPEDEDEEWVKVEEDDVEVGDDECMNGQVKDEKMEMVAHDNALLYKPAFGEVDWMMVEADGSLPDLADF